MDKIDEKDLRRLLKLADRQEIWDAIVSYARGMDRLDPELVLKAYHRMQSTTTAAFCGTPQELVEVGMANHEAENSKTQSLPDEPPLRTRRRHRSHRNLLPVLRCPRRRGRRTCSPAAISTISSDGMTSGRSRRRLCLIEWSSAFPEAYDTGTTSSRAALESIADPRSRRSREDASYIRPLPVSTEKRTPS